MGLKDWFLRKSPQEKLVASIRKHEEIQRDLTQALFFLGNFRHRLDDFINSLSETRAKVPQQARSDIEAAEVEVSAHQKAKREVILDSVNNLNRTLRYLSKEERHQSHGKKPEEGQAIALTLRRQSEELKAVAFVNLNSLKRIMKQYPDVVPINKIDSLFSRYIEEIGRKLAQLDNLIGRIVELEEQQ